MDRRELLKMLAAGAAAPVVGDLTPDSQGYHVAKRQATRPNRSRATMISASYGLEIDRYACTVPDSMELRRR